MFYYNKIFIKYLALVCSLWWVACHDPEPDPYVPPTGTMSDIDGNTYMTVKIGDKWWMKENLKVTKFRNGVPIKNSQELKDWIQPISSYCIYKNDVNAPGLLYNFYAVSDANNIAPEGWHVPTDDEWKVLELSLGMGLSTVDLVNFRGYLQGNYLKEKDVWNDGKGQVGNNESGFSALPGSCRLFTGEFGEPGLGSNGFWWTSSAHGTNAWYRYLDYKKPNVFRYFGPKNYGFSIRCVKD